MVDTLLRPDQRTEAVTAPVSNRARIWTMIVACMGVTLVIASMVALNTALGDIAVATSATQSQLTWIVDCYSVVLACLLLPAGAIGDRYGRRGALLFGLALFAIASMAPTVFTSPVQTHRGSRRRRRRRGVHHARDAVAADRGLPRTTSAPRPSASGPASRVRRRHRHARIRNAAALLVLAIDLLGVRGLCGADLRPGVHRSSSRDDEATPLDWLGAVVDRRRRRGFRVRRARSSRARLESTRWSAGRWPPGSRWRSPSASSKSDAAIPCSTFGCSADPNFATGAAAITVFFLAMFGFFFVIMQYVQLVMGYSPIQTAIALSPLMVPMLTSSGAVAVVSAANRAAAGGVHRPAAHLRRVPVDACPADLHSPYWDMVWPLLVMSTGIGFCTAPSTSAIMAAVPDEKQGVASAVNDTTREVGAALGIALAGSILAATYTHVHHAASGGLPAAVRGPASHSLAQALEVAKTLGPQGIQLAELSQTAFLQAMHSSLLVLGRDHRRRGAADRRCGRRAATANSCAWCAGSLPRRRERLSATG